MFYQGLWFWLCDHYYLLVLLFYFGHICMFSFQFCAAGIKEKKKGAYMICIY